MQPLYEAATKKVPGKTFAELWDELGLATQFEKAKNLLKLAMQLNHPDPAAPIALTTDASSEAIGAVLEQFKDNAWQPLGFWSRHLKPAQKRWSTYRRELFAVHQAMRHFLPQFEGRHTVVVTDHKPLLGAFKSTTSMDHDHIARNQLIEISQFTNDIRYVEGKSNCVADYLSRPPASHWARLTLSIL